MLHGMTTFMSRYGSRHYTIISIHIFTQIHRFVSRIIVIGQLTRRMRHLYIINSIVMQHLDSYIASCHSISCRNLRILFEFALQIHLYQPTYYGYSYK